VAVENTPIRALTGTADILLEDGSPLSFASLFTASRTSPASPLAETLGCEAM
jgi:hypothetical protein